MFIFTVNAIKFSSQIQEYREIFGDKEYYNYYQYIVKCCPIRGEKSIEYSELKSKLRKKFRFSEEKVKDILKKFVDEEYLLISYDDEVSIHLLSNNTRKKILDIIVKFAGIHAALIRRYYHLGTHQVTWHLAFLLEFNFIKDYKFGKIIVFAKFEIAYRDVVIGFCILKTNYRNLMKDLIITDLGQTTQELKEKLNLKNTAIYTAIKKLMHFHILDFHPQNANTYIINSKEKHIIKNKIEIYNQLFIHS